MCFQSRLLHFSRYAVAVWSARGNFDIDRPYTASPKVPDGCVLQVWNAMTFGQRTGSPTIPFGKPCSDPEGQFPQHGHPSTSKDPYNLRLALQGLLEDLQSLICTGFATIILSSG